MKIKTRLYISIFFLICIFCIFVTLFTATAPATANAATYSNSKNKTLNTLEGTFPIIQNAKIMVRADASTDNLVFTFNVSTKEKGNWATATAIAVNTATIYKKDSSGIYQIIKKPEIVHAINLSYDWLGASLYTTVPSGDYVNSMMIKSFFSDALVPPNTKWNELPFTGDGTANNENGDGELQITLTDLGIGEYKAVLAGYGIWGSDNRGSDTLSYEFTYGNGNIIEHHSAMAIATDESGWKLSDGDVTNLPITFSMPYFSGATISVDGVSQESATSVTIDTEGTHKFRINPQIGEWATYNYTIDYTAPQITLSGVADGAVYIKDDVTVNVTDALSGTETIKYGYSDGTNFPSEATIDFTSGTIFRNEGYYLIVATDAAGNKTVENFIIDKTSPIIKLGGQTALKEGTYFSNSSIKIERILEINEIDKILYSRSTTRDFPISADTGCKQDIEFTDEGNYTLTVFDKAGNSGTEWFTIDKTAPTLTVSVASGTFTKNNVTVSWGTDIGNVKAQRVNGPDIVTAYFVQTYDANYLPEEHCTTVIETNGYEFSEVGNYSVCIRDLAGNTSEPINFTIDRTAPTLNVGVGEGEYTNQDVLLTWQTLPDKTDVNYTSIAGIFKQFAHSNDQLIVKYSVIDGAEHPIVAITTIDALSGQATMKEQGHYLVTIHDKAGNESQYTFSIDKTAPQLLVNGAEIISNAVYRSAIVTWSDNYLETTALSSFSELRYSNVKLSLNEAQEYAVKSGDSPTANGIYEITLTDGAGNAQTYTFALINEVYSYNTYKLENSSFLNVGAYSVQIPYMRTITVKEYGKDGVRSTYPGTYSNMTTFIFASYENALRFMVEVEMEEAVTNNGNDTYTYKQLNNSSATTLYGSGASAKATMEELYNALAKYAKPYVKEYAVPLNSPYLDTNVQVMDAEAILGKTADGIQRIGAEYQFDGRSYAIEYKGKNYNYTSLQNLKITSGTATVYDGAYKKTTTLKDYLLAYSSAGANGGLYTVTETDVLGNSFTYSVYLDTSAPTFNANYSYFEPYTDADGNMQTKISSKEIELYDNGQIDRNLRTLSVLELLDNSDEIVTAVVDLPDSTRITTRDLSLLSFGAEGNYTRGGEYHLRLYDRSGNSFEFIFTIYGGAPTVTNTPQGLGDNKTIILTFNNANSYSSIVRFELYRYGTRLPEGEYVEYVEEIPVNTLYIEQGTWSYQFYLGGIYKVRFLDSFGNVTESEEILFTKGLPQYTLSGVENGGRTRKAVTLTFSASTGYEAYKDDVKTVMPVTSTLNGEQKVTWQDIKQNNGQWRVRLYIKSDPNTYLEVTFGIDTIAPTAVAHDMNGEPLSWNTTIRSNLIVQWTDTDVEKSRYTIDNGLAKTYEQGVALAEDGTYIFTLTDDVGNSSTYQIVRDTTVNYKLRFNGTNYAENGANYVRGSFLLENKEWLDMVIYRDGVRVEAPRFNYEYEVEGKYEITLYDGVGNTEEIIVYIDKSAPIATIVAGSDEYSPVCVKLDGKDVAQLSVRHNGKALDVDIEDETSFSDWGDYELTIKDLLGNANAYSFSISKIPPTVVIMTIDGTELESGSSTGKAFYVAWDDEKATARVTQPNGFSKAYEENSVLTQEGAYTIRITDEAKNVVDVTMTIVRTILYTLTDSDGVDLETVWLLERENATSAFSVTYGADATATITRDGVEIEYTSGQILTQDGAYEILLTDGVGNQEERYIVLDTTAPEINATYGEKETDGVSLEISEDTATLTVKHTAASNKMQNVLSGKTKYVFSDWGEYQITVTDLLGNKTEISFHIAKLPPVVNLMTTAGQLLQDGAFSNTGVVVECAEEGVVIRYKINDDSYTRIYQAETILNEQGQYTLTITDLAGTVLTRTFTIDNSVDVKVYADGQAVRAFDEKLSVKQYVDVELREENLSISCTKDGGVMQAVPLENTVRISDEGEYVLTIKDVNSNQLVLQFIIDRTGPKFSISTEDEITKDDVDILLFDLTDVDSYRLNKNGQKVSNFVLEKTNFFNEEATYELTLTDALGNSSLATFEIRRTIAFKLSIPNEFISRNPVSLTLRQEANVQTKLDGIAVENVLNSEGFIFAENGEYEVILTDIYGNSEALKFTVYQNDFCANFEYVLPRNSTHKLLRDGIALKEEVYLDGDKISLTEDGTYTLTLRSDGRSSSYTFTIDTVSPAMILNGKEYASGAEIENLKGDFKVAANKKNCTVQMFYNGAEIENVGDTQSANGHYKVVVKDALGRVAEYEFEKEFTFNGGAIAIFVTGGVLVAIVVLLVIRRRIKMRIR